MSSIFAVFHLFFTNIRILFGVFDTFITITVVNVESGVVSVKCCELSVELNVKSGKWKVEFF